MPSNHLILCRPLLLLPSVFPSIRVFSKESVLPIRWPKYWSFSISTSSEYSGLISFRVDWFDLLAVQGTLKSLLHCHSSKGIYVCHLSVTSYSPCWDLTTKTEFKQHEKMRIKSQCLIYIHLATGDAPVLFKGQAWIDLMQEEALKVLDESLNMIVFTLTVTVVLSSLIGKTFQTCFCVCLVWQTKFFMT